MRREYGVDLATEEGPGRVASRGARRRDQPASLAGGARARHRTRRPNAARAVATGDDERLQLPIAGLIAAACSASSGRRAGHGTDPGMARDVQARRAGDLLRGAPDTVCLTQQERF